jgi:hypothetical protein
MFFQWTHACQQRIACTRCAQTMKDDQLLGRDFVQRWQLARRPCRALSHKWHKYSEQSSSSIQVCASESLSRQPNPDLLRGMPCFTTWENGSVHKTQAKSSVQVEHRCKHGLCCSSSVSCADFMPFSASILWYFPLQSSLELRCVKIVPVRHEFPTATEARRLRATPDQLFSNSTATLR